MGSSVSPVIANIYMEHFEEVVLRTVENSPRLWKRFVDEAFVIQCIELM